MPVKQQKCSSWLSKKSADYEEAKGKETKLEE